MQICHESTIARRERCEFGLGCGVLGGGGEEREYFSRMESRSNSRSCCCSSATLVLSLGWRPGPKTNLPAVRTRCSNSARWPDIMSLKREVTDEAYCFIWERAEGLRMARPA